MMPKSARPEESLDAGVQYSEEGKDNLILRRQREEVSPPHLER